METQTRTGRSRSRRPPNGRLGSRLLLCLVAVTAWSGRPAHAAERTRCDVVFEASGLADGVAIGFIDFTVEYQRPKIFPLDPEAKVACHGLVPGSAADGANVFDGPAAGTLTLAFASEAGTVSGLLRCDVFVPGAEAPKAADFPVITVLRAYDAGQAPVDPLPSVVVGEVRCGVTTTTTTTSTTTSTVLPPSTTTTTLAPELCSVRIRVDSAGALRRLRLDLDYSGAGGEPASPAQAACRGLGGFGLGTLPDTAGGVLHLETVSVAAVQGPADIVACDFVPETVIGGPDDFVVTALLANDGSGTPRETLPAVSTSGARCPSLSTTTTTTSTTLPPPVCGDADGDGEVTAGDALSALRMAVGLPSPCTVATCDVDSGGSVKTSDALRILQAAVGGDVLLACPS